MLYEVITGDKSRGRPERDGIYARAEDDGVEKAEYQPSGEHSADQRKIEVGQCFARSDCLRITSYNVCYTKLLR